MLIGSRRIIDGINHMSDLGSQGLAKERVEKDKAMFGGREIFGKKLAVIGLGHIGAATVRDAAALGMDTVGYDPGLSVSTALKLPREMDVADSISSAVADADYIRYVSSSDDGVFAVCGCVSVLLSSLFEFSRLTISSRALFCLLLLLKY